MDNFVVELSWHSQQYFSLLNPPPAVSSGCNICCYLLPHNVAMYCKTAAAFLSRSAGILIVLKWFLYCLCWDLEHSVWYLHAWKVEKFFGGVERGAWLLSSVLMTLCAAEISAAEAIRLCADKPEFWSWPTNLINIHRFSGSEEGKSSWFGKIICN